MAYHLRRGDLVEVIAGDHKGQRGRILRVLPKRSLVIVQGVNLVYRHVRPSQRNPQGGRLQKEAPLHLSNVLPVDEKAGKDGRPTRVRFQIERDANGRVKAKYRVSVYGNRLGELTRKSAES